jgi:mono/diheme cytochrome c family protein
VDRDTVLIALVLIVPAALLWSIFIVRTGRPARRRLALGIPPAMRPAEPDEALEGPRLERILWGGVIATVATALFIPAYWLPERARQEAFTERFEEESVERGETIFQVPPPLPEEAGAAEFRRLEHRIALGMGCANCHSTGDSSGPVPAGFTDPETGEVVDYMAPPLGTVFQRWDEEVVRFTIERGRPGTPMPTWGVEFGGPMTTQMVNDVVAYLKSLPGNQTAPELSRSCRKPAPDDARCGQEIFTARCADCHGPEGQGKEEEGLTPREVRKLTGEPFVDLATFKEDFPNLAQRRIGALYQGMALWRGDVRHLEEDDHYTTIVNGRRFAFMPAFGETPPQGIPAPTYPLSENQIRAVMAYERSL